jgi:hypothetical protein
VTPPKPKRRRKRLTLMNTTVGDGTCRCAHHLLARLVIKLGWPPAYQDGKVWYEIVEVRRG